jgi:hypothetical protein
MAQPLYVPNVNIPGQGTHNVVYVVTEMDSVYAIDAGTGAQLWHASMLNGGTTASGAYLPCGNGPGFTQEGITGTPVIDPNTNTMYLVAKTLLNTTVRHHLHAIDITTGNEQPGSPVLIQASSTSNLGHKTTFNSLHEKNRPGLLLLNGVIYMGFGSNFCNDSATGWILSYDAATLTQKAVFNTSPDYGLASVWQGGTGLAADEAGNIFFETAETTNGPYDIQFGGQNYCNSVIKLAPDLTVADYFTPYSVAYLNAHDFDLSSTGALVLPDLSGATPHELIAGGKQGVVYVLNRDQMGMYSTNDTQILQEITLVPNATGDVLFGSPAYWNNTVYFAPDNAPIMAFPLLPSGLLGTSPLTTARYPGSHSPSISANGNTNGIMWAINGAALYAFDAVSMKMLYNTSQAPGKRDTLPQVGHFVTQTVANGRVYVGTRTSLEAYGLLHLAYLTGGAAQTATANTPLPAPIQVLVANPYNGQPDVGATVKFTDGCNTKLPLTCGSFNPPSAITDSNGHASFVYTVPKKAGTYTLTVSGSGLGSVTTTATAVAGAATLVAAYSGLKQSGPAGFTLANPVVFQVQDAVKNGISGVTVNFAANHGAVPSPSSAVTDANGLTQTTLRLPTTVATIIVTPSSTGLRTASSATEYSVAGPATTITITSGNNQFAPAGTQLPQALIVLVTDRYENPVSGDSVSFDDGGTGGSFSNSNPVVTGSNGTATELYTLPAAPGAVTIHATASGVGSPATFTETGQ